jgi:hypothetical protein
MNFLSLQFTIRTLELTLELFTVHILIFEHYLAFVGWLSLKFLHNMPKAFRLQNGRNLPRPLICFLNQPREHRPKKRTGTLRGHYYFQKTNKTKTKKIAYQCLHHSLPSQNAKFTIWIIFKKSSCFSPG